MTTTDGTPMLVRIAQQVEDDERLDPAVQALRPVASAVDELPGVHGMLHGRPLGHAAHPLLTDAPLGAWMSATVLDLVGGPGARDAARTLTGFGVLTSLPTVVTGLAEWAHTEQRDARTGVVHAAGNTVALACFATSWLARRAGANAAGVALSLAGVAAASASGYLGAHLAIARNVGSRDAAFVDSEPLDAVAGAGTTPETT